MAYGVTKEGFITKPKQAILDSLSAAAKQQWGEKTPTTPDSVLGQFFNVIASTAKDGWDVTQASASMQNREEASGRYLDFLARITGLTRLAISGSTGNLLFTGDSGTTVQPFTACKDEQNRNVLTNIELTLNRSSCYSSTFEINDLQDSTDYTIVVEGTTLTTNSGVGATKVSVLQALEALVTGSTSMLPVVDTEAETLLIKYYTWNNNLTTTNSDNITLQYVSSLVESVSALQGADVNFSAGTVTTLVSSNLGVESVTNPVSFQNGRDEESDAELRIRMDSKEESAGTATKPSIEASLSEIIGVTSALVVRNNTLVDDPVTGIPAKHFETFIRGGSDADIAAVLWRTAPLFGNYHGDVEQVITDENGDNQSIKYTRPTNSYAHVRVTYAIDPEGSFPADGEQSMREAVVKYGNGLSEGNDLVPSKFYGPLYTVEGVLISNIQVAVTTGESDTPVWQATSVPVDPVDSLIFNTSRVIITT